MLSKLIIDNYALIDNSEIELQDGFTVITGQTGAGKSIMLDALSLLMGSRADIKARGSQERKTVVEAIFSNPAISIKEIFEENGIDWDPEELIIRREISPLGKSRGFINDTPVNLRVMANVAQNLFDIHSQHNNSLLGKSHEQLKIIDAFGKTDSYLKEYQLVFHKYVDLRNRVKKLKEIIAQGKENHEFILFRLEQLEKLKARKGELASLEREAEILSDADRIKSDLTDINDLLEGNDRSILHQIQKVTTIIGSIDLKLFDSDGNDDLLERINILKIELRDIADTIESYNEKINADPERLEKVQIRIEAIYEAMSRFKVKSEDELIILHQQLKDELKAINGDDTNIPEMEVQLKELAKDLKEKADLLTKVREKAAKNFSDIIVNKIKPLGLPNIKFIVEIAKSKLSAEGQDNLEFFCSFNKNHPMQPISEIASGGELARVMLGIKSVISENMKLPTVIFDEIDTGVSGEIAHKMGKMMKEMSSELQVLAVTHLPQVAANGDAHLKVYKDDNNDKTVSHIKELIKEERVREIAGMLSGNTINEVALENAKILLESS